MSNKANYPITPSPKLFFVVGIVLIIWSLALFPLHRLPSKERLNNPHRAQYYITLQSILANYPMLSADKANVLFIKNRLLRFEKDMQRHMSHHVKIVSAYRKQYLKELNTFGIHSVKQLRHVAAVIQIATQTAPIIDAFYLDKNLFHINPLYHWEPNHSRRILQFNLGGLYQEIPNRNMRILAAYLNDSQLGVYSGFIVNNQTTTLETQFMTGLPMLTALYVMPKYDYGATGTLSTMVPWGYFGVNSFFDPVIRKVLDIGGIDAFGVLKSQMRNKKIQTIPGAKALRAHILPIFSTDYMPFLNTRSYGMAYLANHITTEKPNAIQPYEKAIKNYFADPINHHPQVFLQTTHVLYSKLMALKQKHDIIMETNLANHVLNRDANSPAGKVNVQNIVGERVLLNTDCARSSCTLVLNVADSPGWHAFVNGNLAKISRANFAFMATEVPHGPSTVWFIYSPLSALVSYFISILTLFWMLTVCRKKY